MSQQIIGIGTNPNDGTGDAIRSAFTKVNQNFAELYQSGSILNARFLGAKADGVTDDAPVISSAMQASEAGFAAGQPNIIVFPPGIYRIASALPTNGYPVSLFGAGANQTWFLVDAGFAGDVFSWSDVWIGTAASSSTINLAASKRGVTVSGLSVLGNRLATAQQNAFVFYDRADFVNFRDVGIHYINGRAIYGCGILKNAPESYLRESCFQNVEIFRCGATGAPVVEIGSIGTGERSNEIDIDGLNIFAPYDIGLVLRGNRTGTAVNDVKIGRLRIEGLQSGTTAAPLLQIGDATLQGNVNNIYINDAELIDPYTGYPALLLTATSNTTAPYQIHFKGTIGGGGPNGKGIEIDAGRGLSFDIRAMNTIDTNLVVGSGPKVGSNIVINAYGQESSWTTSIDPSSVANVQKPAPLRQFSASSLAATADGAAK